MLSNTYQIILKKIRLEIERFIAIGKYFFLKKSLIDRLASKLSSITIETTNICNANCIFCAYQYQERPTGVMRMDLFQRVIDEFSAMGGTIVCLTPTVGDPLVDTYILDRIRYARTKSTITQVGMYSNLILLKKWGAAALVKSGLTHLVVSMSGFDEQMYRRVYRSKHYADVFKNILTFIEENQRCGNPVDFRIDMRVDRPLSEVYQSPDLLKVAGLIGIDRISVKFAYDSWAGKITKEQLSGNMKLRHPNSFRFPRISPCSQLYFGLSIYWDGKVGACSCRDVDAKELQIGNLDKQSLNEIWFGNELKKLREEFMTPKVREICKKCSHYNNLSTYLMRSS